ncbi:CMGC/CDK protein kinase [Microbotryum lychnidis-dioicae p1A1 Lamole]|uniref:cyclin-dependent kinase n=1 Tax=Microbotryum lychnidis-dioicae (strain p1A1 Lamole / MvSl-1064) TaxID=683840 RepID=U5HB00_USTV1|nr:CMGC/CDK protein kinase [Microbotryum lychnidis-dioicae p1A1 Lamole]|eukprot:KDE05227.1 CMGC/CDK protein kinase [Microbotryum lychnidis-dioicae p1A1 Lamole]
MTLQVEHYNLEHSPTLHTGGTLQGSGVHVIGSSVAPLASGPASRHFVASLSQPLTAHIAQDGAQDRIVIKVVTHLEAHQRRPHHIGREISALASSPPHANVLTLLNAYASSTHYSILTPFYPYSLRALLDNSSFVPSSPSFLFLVLALSHQLVQALDHLHHTLNLAHRDLNPSNIVIASNGRLKLIDFGCCLPTPGTSSSASDFPFVDGPKGLEHDFGTLPYRAPELIFGSNAYDPKGLDHWMLGCTLAEFWTPFENSTRDPDSDDSDSNSNSDPQDGYWSEPPLTHSSRPTQNPAPPQRPNRQRLFTLPSRNPTDFSLLASIFSTLGTPTLQTWPEARALPNFGYFIFQSHPVDSEWVRKRCTFFDEVGEERRDRLKGLEKMIAGLVRISEGERWGVESCLKEGGWDTVEMERMIVRGELGKCLEEYWP